MRVCMRWPVGRSDPEATPRGIPPFRAGPIATGQPGSPPLPSFECLAALPRQRHLASLCNLFASASRGERAGSAAATRTFLAQEAPP
jgi:hypothetical protein